MQFLKLISLIFPLILFINCFGSKFQKNKITPNDWEGQSIRIADLGDSYKGKHRFNKVFSKFSSKRFIPYYKLRAKTYNIIGSYNKIDNNFIIIKDEKGRYFKISQKNRNYKNNVVPSFLVFEENFEKAKLLINTKVWLNNVLDEENFLTEFPNAFYPFQSVEVKDVIAFQNSDNGYPVWLKIIAKNGEDGLVRYNTQGVREGIKDHYFTNDPLPIEWGREINGKIKNRKADLGMSSRQVRIAIGYPDKINSTSSRHGVSEQWIYFLLNKKTYYQFEYDKLVYINH